MVGHRRAADPLIAAAVRQPDHAGEHSIHRQSDWIMARSTLGLGAWMAIWPHAVAQSHFAPIHDFLGYWLMMVLCFVFGGSRYIALWKNGDWPLLGPILRMAGAAFGGVLLVSIAVALARQSWSVDRDPSPGIIFYLMFAWGEGTATRRAASDVRTRI